MAFLDQICGMNWEEFRCTILTMENLDFLHGHGQNFLTDQIIFVYLGRNSSEKQMFYMIILKVAASTNAPFRLMSQVRISVN